jgi:hypothetical protein
VFKELPLAVGQKWIRRDNVRVIIDRFDKTAGTKFPFRAIALESTGQFAGWYNSAGQSVTADKRVELEWLDNYLFDTVPPTNVLGDGTVLPFYATASCVGLSGELVCSFELNGKTYEGIAYPKPKSKKAQALALIDNCRDPEGDYLNDDALALIREVVEAAPNDF